MVNSSLTPRRVVTAVTLALLVSLSGCSTPGSSLRATKKGSHASETAVLQEAGTAPAEAGVYERRIADYEAHPEYRYSHARRITYVDALLHRGHARKAVQELVETELSFPDAYLNAVYLGLAYEIMGDLKSARHWVARSIERNVDARSGSEWLHLAMIDARLALAKDPEWLRKHSVLENNTHRTAEEILNAIRIQLAVRGDFGLQPDLVVCDLYFEAGICAPSLAARQDYFAHSLELSTLRRPEIERQEKIRARAHASVNIH